MPPMDVPPLEPVVLVQVGDATCAGVLIDARGTVATAYHCVARGLRPALTTRDGFVARGRVTRVDVGTDLALIEAPALAGRPAMPIGIAPALGATVWSVGHPYGSNVPGGFYAGTLRWSVGAGEVAAIGDRALQVTVPLQPGNSGGPIVDGDGAVVGIVSRRMGGGGPAFAGRSERLASLVAGETGRAPGLGGTLEAGVSVWLLGATPSYGAHADLVLRDRLVVSAGAAAAVGARWDALQGGETTWQAADLRVALRQRAGRGDATLRFDAWAELVATTSWRSPDDDPLRLRPGGELAPAFGGAVWSKGFGLDVGVVKLDAGWVPRVAIGARWPGLVAIF